MSVQKVLIVGGGISGLSLASGLASNGFDVDVVELKARVVGAGVGFWAFATRALDFLGVVDEVRAVGDEAEKVKMCTADGTLVAESPFNRIPGEDYPGSLVVSRPVLAKVLHDAALARGVRIKDGVTVADLADGSDGAWVTFTDGSDGRYDLVVGADGVFSMMRKRFIDPDLQTEIIPTGVWRTMIPETDLIPGPVTFDLPSEERLVYMYPAGSGQIYVGVVGKLNESRRLEGEDARARVLQLLEPYGGPEIEYMRHQIAVAKTIPFYRNLEFHFVDGDWYRGRVVLIGDAAHSMSPLMAGGATSAVEDAAVLLDELKKGNPLPETLDRFMARRLPRTKRIYEVSRFLAEQPYGADVWEFNNEEMIDTIDFLAQPA